MTERTSDRTNEQWLFDLAETEQNSSRRARAIEDLSARLQRAIFYYLSRERSDLSSLASDEITQMAQDFAQDSVLRVLNNLDSFRGDSQFTTWATKVAMRVAISEMRRARYKDFSLDALSETGEVQPADNAPAINGEQPEGPDRAVEQADVMAKVQAALADVLTKRQRTALEAVVVEGVPIEVVAERMGTNRNALYKLIHDARRKLRTHLVEVGLAPDYIMGLFEK